MFKKRILRIQTFILTRIKNRAMPFTEKCPQPVEAKKDIRRIYKEYIDVENEF